MSTKKLSHYDYFEHKMDKFSIISRRVSHSVCAKVGFGCAKWQSELSGQNVYERL